MHVNFIIQLTRWRSDWFCSYQTRSSWKLSVELSSLLTGSSSALLYREKTPEPDASVVHAMFRYTLCAEDCTEGDNAA